MTGRGPAAFGLPLLGSVAPLLGSMAPLVGSLTLLVASCGAGSPLRAQDAHYWAQQYGTRSELLGGTVVGSPQDLSTTYYNPGGLALLESPTFQISAAAIEVEEFSLEAPSGPDPELHSRRVAAAPALFAGTFPRSWVNGRLAYSYIVRQRLDFRMDEWLPQTADEPLANLLVDNQVMESWGGVTWATPVGPFGFGITAYGAYRSHRNRTEVLTQPLDPADPATTVAAVNDYSYWTMRALAKVGLHWSGERLSVGLAVTTPGLQVLSSGSASYFRSLPADTAAGDPRTTSALDVDDPEVEYRSPWSFAIGARYPVGRGAVYLTSEWFAGKPAYSVLSAPELQSDQDAASLRALVTEDLDDVFNIGIGGEYAPADRLTLIGAVITDFSAAESNPAAAHSLATWDMFQISLGAAFSALRSDFTLGLSYGAGDDRVPVAATPGNPDGIASTTLRQRRLKLFVGFELLSAGPS